jgi:DNA-nicking Smr family endonuclease
MRAMAEKKSKRGIRFLSGDDDLERMFGAGHSENDEAEDFIRLLEGSLAGMDACGVVREKEPRTPETLRLRERLSSYPPPQAELDLHGLTAGEAGVRAGDFILSSARQGLQTLRIIVGKGLHSAGKPVLPDVVERTVVELKRAQRVLFFCWEKRAKHKSGSLIVYLAREAAP